MAPAVIFPKGPQTRAGARMPPFLTAVSQNFTILRNFTSHPEDANHAPIVPLYNYLGTSMSGPISCSALMTARGSCRDACMQVNFNCHSESQLTFATDCPGPYKQSVQTSHGRSRER